MSTERDKVSYLSPTFLQKIKDINFLFLSLNGLENTKYICLYLKIQSTTKISPKFSSCLLSSILRTSQQIYIFNNINLFNKFYIQRHAKHLHNFLSNSNYAKRQRIVFAKQIFCTVNIANLVEYIGASEYPAHTVSERELTLTTGTVQFATALPDSPDCWRRARTIRRDTPSHLYLPHRRATIFPSLFYIPSFFAFPSLFHHQANIHTGSR